MSRKASAICSHTRADSTVASKPLAWWRHAILHQSGGGGRRRGEGRRAKGAAQKDEDVDARSLVKDAQENMWNMTKELD